MCSLYVCLCFVSRIGKPGPLPLPLGYATVYINEDRRRIVLSCENRVVLKVL